MRIRTVSLSAFVAIASIGTSACSNPTAPSAPSAAIRSTQTRDGSIQVPGRVIPGSTQSAPSVNGLGTRTIFKSGYIISTGTVGRGGPQQDDDDREGGS
jgi:hypothetical protein